MARLPGPKSTGLLSFYLLVQGYFMTGRFSVFWEDMLYNMAAVGFPMTIPIMHRSLVVLLGHLTWIVLGGLILGMVNHDLDPSLVVDMNSTMTEPRRNCSNIVGIYQ